MLHKLHLYLNSIIVNLHLVKTEIKLSLSFKRSKMHFNFFFQFFVIIIFHDTTLQKVNTEYMHNFSRIFFGMATMPFLCNGPLLFQGNLPMVLPVIILKYASCLIPYIVSFLFLCGKWSSLVFKDFQKYFLV